MDTTQKWPVGRSQLCFPSCSWDEGADVQCGLRKPAGSQWVQDTCSYAGPPQNPEHMRGSGNSRTTKKRQKEGPKGNRCSVHSSAGGISETPLHKSLGLYQLHNVMSAKVGAIQNQPEGNLDMKASNGQLRSRDLVTEVRAHP